MTDISRRWQPRLDAAMATLYQPAPERTPEQRMSPIAAGTVLMLRERGHTVTVRATRDGSLRYTIDAERERNALQLSGRLRKLYGML